MAEPSVSAGVAHSVVEFAVSRGASRPHLLAAADIAPETLADFDHRVPLDRYLALLRAAKIACADPAFALHYGDSVNLAEASVVGLIGYTCETMLDAFSQLSRYSRLIADVDCGPAEHFELRPDADGLWLLDNRERPNESPELTEIAFSQMVNGTRRFGDTPFVLELRVTFPDPGYRAEYERIFGAPVAFESDRNGMRIDPAWLTYRVAQQPAYVFGVLTRHADAMLEQLEASRTVRGQVDALLMATLHKGETAMGEVARALGFSRDTLYRRLREEGVTYAAVLDELRRKLALEYVAAGKVSLNEIAYLVGFSDPAAFSRAFVRWTGVRPSRARDELAEARA
jgi:AraC-like DNA-binding protein